MPLLTATTKQCIWIREKTLEFSKVLSTLSPYLKFDIRIT